MPKLARDNMPYLAAHMNKNLAISRDLHATDFEHFNIKKNCGILSHDTPDFKITLPDLATICSYVAYFIPFNLLKNQHISNQDRY